jgi:hypothetical protein
VALLTDIQANKASNYPDIPTSNQIKLLHTMKTTRDMSLSHEERLKLAIMDEELTEVNRTTLIRPIVAFLTCMVPLVPEDSHSVPN